MPTSASGKAAEPETIAELDTRRFVVDCDRLPMPLPRIATVLAFAGYVGAAVLFTWPLASRLSSHVLGPISGDTGVYLWNLWSFAHEVSQGRNPFFTTAIFSLSSPTDLALHNYTALNGAIATLALGRVSLTALYNLILLATLTLNGFFGYLLARRLTGRADVAWTAGLLFGFSPFVMARAAGHLSLVAVAPLAAVWLSADSLRRTGRRRAAVAAGVSLAWALYSDPYYLVYCLLLSVFVFAPLSLSAGGQVTPFRRRLARWSGGVAAAASAAAGVIWATGGWHLAVGPVVVSAHGVHNPVFVATLAAAGCWLLGRPWAVRVAWSRLGLLRPHTVALAAATVLLLMGPWLVALWSRVADGGQFSRPLVWRSSVPGADLLAFVLPNPTHPLMRPLVQPWLEGRPGGLIENVVSVSLVALAVIMVAVGGRRVRLPRLWAAIAIGSAILALGPFLMVGGVMTHVPLPWFFLGHLPLLGAASAPARFAAPMMLGLTALFALALAAIAARDGRGGRLLVAFAALALIVELLPVPRVLHAADVPDVFAAIAADPRPVTVLHLPFGFRDGTKTVGYYNNARQYYQTSHGKRLIGGYISRLSPGGVSRLRRSKILRTLLYLSEGRPYEPPPDEVLVVRGAAFVRRAHLGYVVVDRERTPPKLLAYAVASFSLDRIGSDSVYDLYRPAVALDAVPPSGQSPPGSHARGVTTALSMAAR